MLDRQIFGALHARERFVNRHGADRHRRGVDDRLANGGDVAAGRKVHHRVRAVVHRVVQLFQLFVDVRGGRGIADVRVDLAVERDADAHGLEVAMVDVGGNDGAAARDFAAHQFRLDLLARRDELHLFGDHALARVVHLRNVSRAAVHRRRTLLDPAVSQRHKFLRSHEPRPLCNAPRPGVIIALGHAPGNRTRSANRLQLCAHGSSCRAQRVFSNEFTGRKANWFG